MSVLVAVVVSAAAFHVVAAVQNDTHHLREFRDLGLDLIHLPQRRAFGRGDDKNGINIGQKPKGIVGNQDRRHVKKQDVRCISFIQLFDEGQIPAALQYL